MSGSYDEASDEVTDSFWEVSRGLGSCLYPDSTCDLNSLGLFRIPSVQQAAEALKVGLAMACGCSLDAAPAACGSSHSGTRPLWTGQFPALPTSICCASQFS